MAISAPQLRLYLGATKNVNRDNTVVKGLDFVEDNIDNIYERSTKTRNKRVQDMQATLKELNDQKQNFLRLTGCNTLQELQNRVNKAYQEVQGLRLLTGTPMYVNFIKDALRTAGISRAYQEDYFQKIIQEAWNSKTTQKSIDEATGPELGKAVVKYLREVTGRKYVSFARFDTLASYKEATLDRLTVAQRDGFLNLYKQYGGEIDTDNSNHTNWFTIVDYGKTSQKVANNKFINDENEKNDFIKQMLTFIQQTLSIQDHSDLYKCIKEVLTAYPAGFYTGTTEQGITTTIEKCLGEIQGLYIARAIFPHTGYDQKVAEWIGGIKQNGVDPHEDILIQLKGMTNKLGFQIKNTTSDVTSATWNGKNIEFASRKAGTFFNLVNLTDKEQQVLAEIYNMEAFNNEYVYDSSTHKFTNGYNETFAPYREKIVTYARIADKILSLFADVLLFMSTDRASEILQSPGNIIYLVGSKLYFAYDILNTIYKELKLDSNSPHFLIKAKYGSKTARDIADYWNEMSRAKTNKRATARKAIGSLKLTSSYLFE